MLFNSFEFVFLFLPATLVGFFLVARWAGRRPAVGWLVAASAVYYGSWNPRYLVLIGASLAFNFWLGRSMTRRERQDPWRRRELALGVVGNLVLLGYYKYANFFVENLQAATSLELAWTPVLLPIAISFFTFQQIAYLVDSYYGRTREPSFLNYSLFVTFFPQLIAGPIVHHKEMLPQFEETAVLRIQPGHFAVGISIFVIGLFKKVVIADSVALYSTPFFDAARDGVALSSGEAWVAALAFTLQLYFDFSGYSDMAIGLARMFGIRLPFNFASPYKSTSISEFWRRWHITLSRFLRDYLFILLGGNRRGAGRGQLNLFVTMVLGGLWHGAGWTFIVWGALHGFYLVVNYGFRQARSALGWNRPPTTVGRAASVALTFVACVFTLVFFRAESLESAFAMTGSMLGIGGPSLPEAWRGWLGGAAAALENAGVAFRGAGLLGASDWLRGLPLIAGLLVIVFAFPNTQEYIGLTDEDYYGGKRRGRRTLVGGPLERFRWRPSPGHFAFILTLAFLATGYLGNANEFLYYQF